MIALVFGEGAGRICNAWSLAHGFADELTMSDALAAYGEKNNGIIH
jgi:hypothetical protein